MRNKETNSFLGPVRNRNCTNKCFAFLFFLFLIAWAVLTQIGIKYGDINQVVYPSDSYGRICGRGALEDKKYLFFFNILKCLKVETIGTGCDTPMVCVKKCPNYSASYAEYKNQENFDKLKDKEKLIIKSRLICDYNYTNFDVQEIPNLLRSERCASKYFNEINVAGRCLPMFSKIINETDILLEKEENNDDLTIELSKPLMASSNITISDLLKDYIKKVIEDLNRSKETILIGLVIGMLLSFVWIVLIQFIAGAMIWFSMIAFVFLIGLISIFCFKKYKYLLPYTPEELKKMQNDDFDKLDINIFSILEIQFISVLSNKNIWLGFSIVSGIMSFTLCLIFIFLRQRAKIAIHLIKEASKAIMFAKFTLISPVIPFIFQVFVLLFGLLNTLLITALNKDKYRLNTHDQYGVLCDIFNSSPTDCVKMKYLNDNYATYVHLYNIFGIIWLITFIGGMYQVVFSGVFSRYYWTWNKKKDVPNFLILNSTCVAFRYHIGSVAIGSFLISTVKFIRFLIEYINRKCKQYSNNAISKGILWTFRCCFWCLDNFLRYLNTNAYIMIAIYGKGFFASAKDAFTLLVSNIIRVVVVDKVVDYLLLVSKLCVSLLMCILSFFYFNYNLHLLNINNDLLYLNNNWIPIAAITIGTYILASGFFSVYNMAVDTIFLCFLKDCEENDGSQEKPYYMSKDLMRILKYKNDLKLSSRK